MHDVHTPLPVAMFYFCVVAVAVWNAEQATMPRQAPGAKKVPEMSGTRITAAGDGAAQNPTPVNARIADDPTQRVMANTHLLKC